MTKCDTSTEDRAQLTYVPACRPANLDRFRESATPASLPHGGNTATAQRGHSLDVNGRRVWQIIEAFERGVVALTHKNLLVYMARLSEESRLRYSTQRPDYTDVLLRGHCGCADYLAIDTTCGRRDELRKPVGPADQPFPRFQPTHPRVWEMCAHGGAMPRDTFYPSNF